MRFRANQAGAVLVVGLIMLAVMTLLVISMLKTSVIELKIGGANQEAALNFANVELKMREFLKLNQDQDKLRPGLSTGANALVPAVIPDLNVRKSHIDALTVTEVACAPAKIEGWSYASIGNRGAGGLDAVYFEVTATATSDLGASITGRQGIRRVAGYGMCPTR